MRNIYFLVKFVDDKDHAEEFVNRGRLLARSLSEFKNRENCEESGRVDSNDGTVAWLQPSKVRLTINGMDISADLAAPVTIQMDAASRFNVFCLHACHSGALDVVSLSNENIEDLRKELVIDERCFRFGSHAVMIKDVPEFIDRMKRAATARNYQISYGPIKYYTPATYHGHFRDIESGLWKQNRYRVQL